MPTTKSDNSLTTSEVKSVTVENEALARMYMDNANVGAENLAGELPLLKIHKKGKSQNNELADGSEPNNGWFYYKPTKEQFEEIKCHVLTISRGYQAPPLEEGNNTVFTQILAGIIINQDNPLPFMMYFTGLKLENLWKFGKEVRPYTKAKPMPIPMFALTVKLTTREVEHSKSDKFGKASIVEFEVVKNDKGIPEIVKDEGEFVFLRDSVDGVQETINNLIANKTGEEADATMIPAHPVNEAQSVEDVKHAVDPDGEDDVDVDDKDIPF